MGSIAKGNVPPPQAVEQLSAVLGSPEICALIAELEETRWTGRPGFPIRAMVGMALVKSLYAIPTWSRTARLVAEHPGLQTALGCCPSVYACYSFTAKLREYGAVLNGCIASVLASLRAQLPEFGRDVAIDASDMPAYANGQRFLSKNGPKRERYSDPDASWGHRSAVSTRKGGGFYGYRIHSAVCLATDLPVAWEVATGRSNESIFVGDLLDSAATRGFDPDVCVLDRGYDVSLVYDACEERGIRPVIPLRETPAVKRGAAKPHRCEHGEWIFAGADAKHGRTKWRCPTGACQPMSRWIKADRLHPLIPRETPRWRKLYHSRGAVERQFGRLKNEWALLPLRVRGLDRVRLHADLTILATLACRLAQERARAVPIAA